ncbi:hypothetical protein [Geminisphaera colitermitum]|uniref:hypothetical protein n=1 Tax=Geminisphaera colitermitum TaxID=1148786 RepID=UPI000158CC3D|nr:hypothetical protein [Geminisphaera colitermitum]
MIFCRFPFFLLLAGLFFVSGCSTFDSRSREKQAVFQSLDAATQERLKAKQAAIGDTEDMVYIALGEPHHKQELTTEAGSSVVWIYITSWQEFQGMAFVGYRRDWVPDGHGGQRVIYTPDERPVYAERSEELCRITFTDGKVTLIEQAQPGVAGK